MRRLLDTSILIRQLRNDPRAKRLLEGYLSSGDELWASVLSRTEVLAGMRSDEAKPTYRLFSILKWVEISRDVADTAGTLARLFRRSHQGIDTADYLIAASAIEVGARLVTLNVKHFPMFPDIAPPYAINQA